MTALTPQESLRAAESTVKKNRAQRKMLDRLFKSWVADSEMTSAQLAQIQPSLKAAFYEREAERRAA